MPTDTGRMLYFNYVRATARTYKLDEVIGFKKGDCYTFGDEAGNETIVVRFPLEKAGPLITVSCYDATRRLLGEMSINYLGGTCP